MNDSATVAQLIKERMRINGITTGTANTSATLTPCLMNKIGTPVSLK